MTAAQDSHRRRLSQRWRLSETGIVGRAIKFSLFASRRRIDCGRGTWPEIHDPTIATHEATALIRSPDLGQALGDKGSNPGVRSVRTKIERRPKLFGVLPHSAFADGRDSPGT